MAQLGQGLEESALSQAIKNVDWIIPLVQSIHIVCIGVVFVSSLMIALRVMGRMRADEPFPAVWNRFAPWMWGGLVVMVVTGIILVIGEPMREFTALSFWLKMTLLAITVIMTFVFGRTMARAAGGGAPSAGGAGYGPAAGQFPPSAKALAGIILVLWLAIIFLGRAIAYDVEVWGSLSLHT
jgi:uncharacterized membrane protein SirB2